MTAAGGPVPIVRRAPAAGLFGRRDDPAAAAGRMGAHVFPWEQLLFAPDAADAAREPAKVVVPFPRTRRR
jgi:hypothetical protein